MVMKFGAGQPVTRKEDQRLLTGQGRYTDDLNLPGQAYAYVLRSPHAHAAIRGIDTSAAMALPGVLCVLTGVDAEADGLGSNPCFVQLDNRDGSKSHAPPHWPLVRDRVRHVGDEVALVVAETANQARDATELIAVDYASLPSITDTAKAIGPGAPLVWDEAANNICFDWETGDKDATDQAFAGAAHVVGIELINNRVVANAMEPRAAIGAYDAADESYTIHTVSQGVHYIQNMLATSVLQVPREKVRVVTLDVGGGFGMKLYLYAEYPLILWASKKIGRPVRWTGDRSQSFVSDAQGRDHVTAAELAFDSEGKILGYRISTIANLGSYLSNFATVVPTEACKGVQGGVYAIPAAYLEVKGVFTHTIPVDAYRGAGRPEASYLIERLIDKAARELGIDPLELRQRNFIAPEAMPFTTAFGGTYDSGEFGRNMAEARDIADMGGFDKRRDAARQRGKRRGIGIAYYIEACASPALGPENATLRVEDDETVTLLIGTQASGQGHETCFAQLVAEGLGVPFDQINMRQGDTAEIAQGGGTGGSRSMVAGGAAVTRAVKDVIDNARAIAAELLEVSGGDIEFADGRFTVAGTDRWKSLFDVAAAARKRSGETNGLKGAGEYQPEAPTYPNGCHIVEVEIDPDTGAIKLVAYTVVDDFGKVINPLLIAGQVHGGIAQGAGQALMEDAIYDEESGQLLTGSFMDYGMPRASDFPPLSTKWNEIPCTTNPLGVKGAGEAGTVGAAPAIINAIVDALSEFGVTHIDMPATPETIWQAIHGTSG